MAYRNGRQLPQRLPAGLAFVEESILEEPEARYKQKTLADPEELELARHALFPGVVTREYNYTCCISGMKVIVDSRPALVEACHIVPFKYATHHNYGKINFITNALALCPNLHKAFDKHLITITDDYKVMMKRDFHEAESDYGIRKYEGRELLLPVNRDYWPEKENLKWHREWGR